MQRCRSCGVRSRYLGRLGGELVCSPCLLPLLRMVRREVPGFVLRLEGGAWWPGVAGVEGLDSAPAAIAAAAGFGVGLGAPELSERARPVAPAFRLIPHN